MGALAMATGIISDVKVLIVIRFMLGVVESAVMPSMLILLSRWFTKTERSRANTFLILGNPVTILWMSILSGYLIKCSWVEVDVYMWKDACSHLGFFLVAVGK